MKNYYDLEINILACLIQKPELMEKLKLEDKYFVKQQRMWQFMKVFYEKYKTFDVVLMCNVCKDKFAIVKYLEMILDSDPLIFNFEKYQDLLIELYEQKLEEKAKVKLICDYTNELVVGNIDLEEFKEKVAKI